jgi:hypothetical protein
VGDGSLNLSLCNINNIRRVIKNIIEDKIPRGVYNISDNEKYSYRELLNFQKTRSFLKVPFIFLSIIMILNKIIRSVYIDEICLKLSNSFIYPNDKLRRYVDLNNNLNS